MKTKIIATALETSPLETFILVLLFQEIIIFSEIYGFGHIY